MQLEDITLDVFEIFTSVSGEHGIFPQGSICNFIRLAGCNLRCSWCDTKPAQERLNGIPSHDRTIGESMPVKEIIRRMHPNVENVIITGGEPLLQKGKIDLLVQSLKKRNYKISMETNGSIYPSPNLMTNIDGVVIDIKLGSSNTNQNLSIDQYSKICLMMENVWFKFVLKTIRDFIESCQIRAKLLHKINEMKSKEMKRVCIHKEEGPIFLYSPILSHFSVDQLFKLLIIEDIYDGVINIQLHKLVDMA